MVALASSGWSPEGNRFTGGRRAARCDAAQPASQAIAADWDVRVRAPRSRHSEESIGGHRSERLSSRLVQRQEDLVATTQPRGYAPDIDIGISAEDRKQIAEGLSDCSRTPTRCT